MADKEKYPNVARVMIVNRQNVLDTIDESKNHAIKHIMRIVENNINPAHQSEAYKHIRSIVLDEINDVAREFKFILDKILEE